jgi:UDP-4-amino-4,6-dideoxy-N-acetyl-beta-L-altrosamine transaminase
VIPYGRQAISQADIEAVSDVLRSDWLTQGPAVPRFEAAIAQRANARYAVAVNSATSALHIACLALGLGPGELLWTSPNTFVASANCGRYCGADIDFVDIDPATLNMSVTALTEKLVDARRRGRLPKVVVPVHFAGEPTEQEAIWTLAQEFGFRVLEDASHAIGASVQGEPVGSCRWSDIVVFSFHPVKIITTAEGGMALTNDATFAQRMAMLRSHGITRDIGLMDKEADGAWYYEQQMLGFNYRMTDMQAALGLSQLANLESWVERRHQLADAYDAAFADLPLFLPHRSIDSRSALHLYVVQVDTKRSPVDRRTLFNHLRAADIGVNVHYIPVHTQPDFRRLGFIPGDFPNSEAYYAHCLSLPMYASLTNADQCYVIEKIRELLI